MNNAFNKTQIEVIDLFTDTEDSVEERIPCQAITKLKEIKRYDQERKRKVPLLLSIPPCDK